jgi:hypothetical protein
MLSVYDGNVPAHGKESDHERIIIQRDDYFTSDEYLCQPGLRGAVGRVRQRSGGEPRLAGHALELGASITHGNEDHHLGVIPADHGDDVDLGVGLDLAYAPARIWRHRCLDAVSLVQFYASIPPITGTEDFLFTILFREKRYLLRHKACLNITIVKIVQIGQN